MKKVLLLLCTVLSVLNVNAGTAAAGTTLWGNGCQITVLADGTAQITWVWLDADATEWEMPGVITDNAEASTGDYVVTETAAWAICDANTNIKKITLPASLKKIGSSSMQHFSGAEEIVFAEDAAIETVGSSAFWGLTALTGFYFPASVKTVEGYVLGGCTALTYISFGGAPETIGESIAPWDTEQGTYSAQIQCSLWNAKDLMQKLGGWNYKVWDAQINEDWNNGGNLASVYTDAVKVKRTLTSGAWNTICLPFYMTREDVVSVFGSDTKLAEFTGVSGTEMQFTSVSVDAETYFAANRPYLILIGNEMATEFEVAYKWLSVDFSSMEQSQGDYLLEATLDGAVEEVPENAFAVVGGNVVKITATSQVKGLSAYFVAPAGTETVSVSVDGKPTGIAKITVEDKEDGAVYDLSGRRVNAGQKGLVISNGKKLSR